MYKIVHSSYCIHKYIFWNYILPLKTLKNQYKSKYYLFNFNICKNTGQKYVNKRLHLFNGIFNFCFWIIWFSFSMKKYFNIGRSNNVTDLIDFMKNNFDWFVSYDHIVLNFIPNLTFSDRIEFTLNFQNFIPTKSSIMWLLPLVFFLYPIHVYIYNEVMKPYDQSQSTTFVTDGRSILIVLSCYSQNCIVMHI